MFLEKLDADILELQSQIQELETSENTELEKAQELQNQMNIIHKGVDEIRMNRRNLEVQIQLLLNAQTVLRGYDLTGLEPTPEEPPAEEEPPVEEGEFYPVPSGPDVKGNLNGLKNPIGTYNGKNIYEYFDGNSTDYWTSGEQVKYKNGAVYESLLAVNTWSPDSYPLGWKALGAFDDINGKAV